MFTRKMVGLAVAGALAGTISANANAIAITADIITVVDESGSMSGEHAWISTMISSLDAALATTAGADPLSVQYGLTGFGGGTGHTAGHTHDMDAVAAGTQEFGDPTDFATAAGTLLLNGGTEDGYDGMNHSLSYNLRAAAATNLILVTDEDRDNLFSNTLDYTSMLAGLNAENALVNAVVNCSFGAGVLGVDSGGNAYVADGSGGFNVDDSGYTIGSCAGSTNTDYVDLALATGGAAWNLNLLRAGGLTADSFTAAFVDIKVGEIVVQQDLPEPASLALMGLGLAGIGYVRRRRSIKP